jgi:DNA-binding transcriptional MerR regulator
MGMTQNTSIDQNQSEPQPDGKEEQQTRLPRSRRSRKSSSAFKTISEVAELLEVQQHVLRFWETKFTQVKPLKRGGGRRYYRPEDVELLQTIHQLLYTDGYTIKGVQKLLKGQGKHQIIAGNLNDGQSEIISASNDTPQTAQDFNTAQPAATPVAEEKGLSDKQRSILSAMLGELKDLRDMLK